MRSPGGVATNTRPEVTTNADSVSGGGADPLASSDVTIGMFQKNAGAMEASGIAVYVQRLAEELSELTETILYTKDGPIKPSLESSPAEVVRTPMAGSVPDSLADKLPKTVQHVLHKCPIYAGLLTSDVREHMNEKADVLVTHDWFDDIVISNMVDVPTVRINHGLQQVGIGARAREAFSRSALTLANSENTARELREAFGYTADAIITPGVDTTTFTPDRRPAFESEGTAVLFVGRLVASKGIYDLLDALSKSSGDQTLHVVGRGQIEEVERRAAELGLDDSVVVHGVVPHSRLPHYYTACDFLCNPSRYESFSMVNVEAMACGTPVVSTDLEGTEEYLVHGETGWRVPPGDPDRLAEAIEELSASPELLTELGDAGREVAREYSWESSARKLGRICSDLHGTVETQEGEA